MGESLANYKWVITAVGRITSPVPDGFGISQWNVVVSTVGLTRRDLGVRLKNAIDDSGQMCWPLEIRGSLRLSHMNEPRSWALPADMPPTGSHVYETIEEVFAALTECKNQGCGARLHNVAHVSRNTQGIGQSRLSGSDGMSS